MGAAAIVQWRHLPGKIVLYLVSRNVTRMNTLPLTREETS